MGETPNLPLIQCSPLWDSGSSADGGTDRNRVLCKALCPGPHRALQRSWGDHHTAVGPCQTQRVLGRLGSQLELLVASGKSLLRLSCQAGEQILVLTCVPACRGTGAETGERALMAEIGPHTQRWGFPGRNEHARVCSPGTHRYTHVGMQGPRCTCAHARTICRSTCRPSRGDVNSGCAHVVVDRVAGCVCMGFNTQAHHGCLKHAHTGAPK